MNIFWKNFTYIAILLILVNIILIYFLPLSTQNQDTAGVLSDNKFNIFIYFLTVLAASATISIFFSKNIGRYLDEIKSEIDKFDELKKIKSQNIFINSNFYVENNINYLKNYIKESF